MIRSLARFARNQRILALVRLYNLRSASIACCVQDARGYIRLQSWGKILGYVDRSEGLTIRHVIITRRKEEVTPACGSQ